MAGIGDDIKEVLDELGSTAVISRVGSATTYTEMVDLESFPTHSSEFIRQFFSTITIAFDTAALPGDIILVHGNYYILTNLISSFFEDAVVDITGALYKCNCNGVMHRPTITVDADYVKQEAFALHTGDPTSIRALQYENKFGMEPLFEDDVQFLLKEKHVLILPSGIDVKEGYRWFPDYTDTTKFYRIESIESKRLANCIICTVSEDKR